MGFKVTKHVTLPLLKMAIATLYYLRLDSAMEVGRTMPPRMVKNPETGKMEEKQEEPATVAQVTVLDDCEDKDGTQFVAGQVAQILCPTVLVKELNDLYPDAGYKGKSFSVRTDNLKGKRYHAVQIAEVEYTEDVETAPESKPEAGAVETPSTETGATETAKATKKK